MSYPNISNLTAIILAGGLGTRLRSVIGDKTPKVLAPVAGKPFLWYLLEFLKQQNISRVILATGHLSSSIEKALIDISPPEMDVIVSQETIPLGTAGAVKLALKKLNDELFYVFNGDSICLADLSEMLEFHQQKQAKITLLLHRVEDVSRYGSVTVNKKRQITGFQEKSIILGSGYINAGTYLMNRSILENIKENTYVSLEHDMFPELTPDLLFGYITNALFIDIGVKKSFEMAQQFFANWA